LAGGVLVDAMVDRGWEARHPLATGGAARAKMFEVALERAKKVAALREVTGLSLTELAYRFLFSQPEISVVVGGFSDISHLEECLAAEAKGPLDADLLKEIESRI
jgi:aryl-alcohol dehydrogenase-like predicted oxidoreductase